VSRRAVTVLVAAFLATASPAIAAPGPSAGGERVVLSTGHADIGPRAIDGAWRIQVRDDTTRPPTWRDADDVVVHALDAARTTVPQGQAYAFLGTPGSPVWVLPQIQRQDLVWLGWNTQDPSVATAIRREMTWRVHRVDGPGAFVLFLTGNFGAPDVVFDSRTPLPQDSGVEANTHVHGNWVFTAPGTYLIDVEMSATSQQGQPVSGRATLRVFVGAGDPTAAFTPPAGGAPASGAGPQSDSGPDASRAASRESTDRPWLWPATGAGLVLLAVLTTVLLRQRARRAAR
jgi:putative ABC transporter-associated repeat protein